MGADPDQTGVALEPRDEIQVMLVALEAELERFEALVGEQGVVFHLADGVDEALDMIGLIEVDVIAVGLSAGDDPLEVVARYTGRVDGSLPPFVFVESEGLIGVRPGDARREFAIDRASTAELGALLDIVLSPVDEGDGSAAPGDIADALAEIGFNDVVSAGDRSFDIQTQVSGDDSGAAVRLKVFESGRIVVSRSFPVELGDDPEARVRSLADRIHREAVSSVKRNVERGPGSG